jgi:predicted dehydrogenase
VGFIGAGSVLWAYLQQLDRLIPRGLAAEGPICARSRDARTRILQRRPHATAVSTVSEVLDTVDIVVVITPPASHADLVREALGRAKHVLVEKPMALDSSEAVNLVEEAGRRGLVLMAATFVQLAPTVRQLWTQVHDGALGHVHSARALYGNMGSDWARWYHSSGVGPLAEIGIYNLKTLTCLLGPAREVMAMESTAVTPRLIGNTTIEHPDPDVVHVLIRHESGALSSLVASHAIHAYRRPAIELYGTRGTANVLGDDWDPRGLEIWREERGSWEILDPPDATWLWTDGLREISLAVAGNRRPLHEPAQDVHLIEVVEACERSAEAGTPVHVTSGFPAIDLTMRGRKPQTLHDPTRPASEQT